MSDFRVLFPEGETARVGKLRVQVRPVELRHFELFGRVSSSVLGFVASASVEELSAYGREHANDLSNALAAVTDLSGYRIRRMPVAAAIQLLLFAIKVNAGFFAQAQLAAAQALDGQQ